MFYILFMNENIILPVVLAGGKSNRFGKDKSIVKLRLKDMILSNSTAGLIDLNINQEQKLIGAGCFPMVLKDYSIHAFYGSPKQGQSLEEVKVEKKKTVKKTTKKTSKIKDEFNKVLAKKLHERFSGIKTKDKGDGIMVISFK